MLLAEKLVEAGLLSKSQGNYYTQYRKEYDNELRRKKPRPDVLARLKKVIGIEVDGKLEVL